MEQELLTGAMCRKDLASQAQIKQNENQVIKEELQAVKIQNRNRTANPTVHGESTAAFGGKSFLVDGPQAKVPQNAPQTILPQNVPQKAYDFGSVDRTPIMKHYPTRDPTNSKLSHDHGDGLRGFDQSNDVLGGISGSGMPQVPRNASDFDFRNFTNIPGYAPTQDSLNPKIAPQDRNRQTNL